MSKAPKFFVDERSQLFQGGVISVAPVSQQLGHFLRTGLRRGFGRQACSTCFVGSSRVFPGISRSWFAIHSFFLRFSPDKFPARELNRSSCDISFGRSFKTISRSPM